MSSITTTQAGYLSVPDVAPSYVLDKRPTDQLFEVLPFKPIAGHELRLSAVDAGSAGLSALADAEAAGAGITSTMPAITERTFPLKRISAEMPVDSVIPGIYGGHRDIVQALLQLKVNAVRDHFKLLLVQGDSSAGAGEEFDGLKRLANAYSQEFGADSTAANGGTVQKGEIEDLLNLLNPRPRTNNVYLAMHGKAYKHLVKNNYGDVEFVAHALLGTVPVIAGVPVLIDNFIPVAETQGTSNDCTSIYGVVLGDEVGLVGIYPASAVGQPIQVRGPVVKEATDTMWFHVSWDVGLACYGKGAVARLFGVKHAN